jgi:hypothetical protein
MPNRAVNGVLMDIFMLPIWTDTLGRASILDK